MLVIAAAAMFALVFARAITAYLRTRDRLHGAVALVFAPVAALFLVQVSRSILGGVPPVVRLPALVLLVGQPVLTLGLVALIRSVPRPVMLLAFAGWVASAAAVVAGPAPIPRQTGLSIVAYFVTAQLVAAGYLTREAGHRSGAARARIRAAAAGTALFGLVMLAVGLGPVAPASWRVAEAARVFALAPALCYVMAFLPPAWLRRQWSARTAYGLTSRLLEAAPSASPQEVWQHFAETVRTALAAGCAAVLVPRDSPVASGPVATAGTMPAGAPGTLDDADVRAGVSTRWTRLDGRRYLLIHVPVRLHGGAPGALQVFGLHRSLFTEDDVAVLADLGRQATVLADRAVLTGQLTATVEALRAANEAKSDFVAAMSHELRTPLNAIIGFSELMGFEELIGDRRQVPDEWITNVHSSGRHLLGLINDVLDLAKVEAGRMDLRLEPIDVAAAVAEAVAPLSPLIDGKRLRMTLAAAPELVTADRMRLRQMLNNLLSNAIKFTPAEGAIYVSAHRDGGETHLSVADNGPGIEPADQVRVFEEFHQTGDAESRAAGTGLGLALTRRLAEAHGGRVELWSEPGRGSRFTLILPAAEQPAGPAVPAEPASSACVETGGVLVIEDDPSASSLLRTYLNGAGYTVHTVSSGEAGIELARDCAPELIMLDVLLPGMDGWTVLQRLKADEVLRHIPVVVVTVVDEREVGLALGAVDYFVKPVERGALLDWMARHGVAPEPRREVLVVEPDPQIRDRIGHWLLECGVVAATADSVEDALGVARTRRLDLIMCAAGLAGPSGQPAGEVLDADPATRAVPRVMLTDGDVASADTLLAGLAGTGSNVLGVVSRADLNAQHLRRWLGAAVEPVPSTASPVFVEATA